MARLLSWPYMRKGKRYKMTRHQLNRAVMIAILFSHNEFFPLQNYSNLRHISGKNASACHVNLFSFIIFNFHMFNTLLPFWTPTNRKKMRENCESRRIESRFLEENVILYRHWMDYEHRGAMQKFRFHNNVKKFTLILKRFFSPILDFHSSLSFNCDIFSVMHIWVFHPVIIIHARSSSHWPTL